MGKVFHLNDLEEFFGSDDWKLQINIADIWKQYSNKEITTEDFNKKYYNRLIEYKTDISSLGTDVWGNLSQILPKLIEPNLEEESLTSLYDDIYDWGDKNDIEIKTK